MKEILHRGKRLDNGEWVQGSLLSFKDGRKAIIPSSAKVFMQQGTTTICCNECYDIDPATTGQYTCLVDKNGEKIFEGDIVRILLPVEGGGTISGVSEFYFDSGCFCVNWGGNDYLHRASVDAFTTDSEFEVIGNAYDNPELLEGGDTIATKEERI